MFFEKYRHRVPDIPLEKSTNGEKNDTTRLLVSSFVPCYYAQRGAYPTGLLAP